MCHGQGEVHQLLLGSSAVYVIWASSLLFPFYSQVVLGLRTRIMRICTHVPAKESLVCINEMFLNIRQCSFLLHQWWTEWSASPHIYLYIEWIKHSIKVAHKLKWILLILWDLMGVNLNVEKKKEESKSIKKRFSYEDFLYIHGSLGAIRTLWICVISLCFGMFII